MGFFIEYFRQYLLGRRFVVRSDHQSLIWLFRLKGPRGKIACWIEILSQYDFFIEYRPGHKQGHSDALSRCENPRDCDCSSQDMNEPLKCGPCKKCINRAQDMLHEGLMKEITENSEAENVTTANGKDADAEQVRAAKEEVEPQPVTSYQEDGNRRMTRQNAYTPWANGWSIAELQTLQLEDPDVGPILQAKLADKKPDSKEMVRKSPACRQ